MRDTTLALSCTIGRKQPFCIISGHAFSRTGHVRSCVRAAAYSFQRCPKVECAPQYRSSKEDGMQLTVGQIIGKALKAYGVPYITGLPGHGNWNLLDAFNDPVSNVPIIQTMHEQAAIHVADAHYRVTGNPIACCTSIGPGAANTVMGLANAHCDSTALLLITGSASTYM